MGTIARYTEPLPMSIQDHSAAVVFACTDARGAPGLRPFARARRRRNAVARPRRCRADPTRDGRSDPVRRACCRRRAPACRQSPLSPPRGGEPDHPGSSRCGLPDRQPGARSRAARRGGTVDPCRPRRCRSIARRHRWLGGPPPGIVLGLWRALRHGDRRVCDRGAGDNRREGCCCPVLGAGDRRDALSLPRRGTRIPGLAPPVAGACVRRSPPQDDRGPAKLGIARFARPGDTLDLGRGDLRGGARPARLLVCRRHRHAAVEPTRMGEPE